MSRQLFIRALHYSSQNRTRRNKAGKSKCQFFKYFNFRKTKFQNLPQLDM